MERRLFLSACGAAACAAIVPQATKAAAAPAFERLLVLVELKGGNDGLNTVVPFADPGYAALRPHLALRRDELLPLDARCGLHPSLAPLRALWEAGELAVVQSVGYPLANLSHFRSIEIWDTASRSDQYLVDGWLARAFALNPPPADYAADGVALGGGGLGPLAGTQARALAIARIDDPGPSARPATPAGGTAVDNGALRHLLKVDHDLVAAGERLVGERRFATTFPDGPFGAAVRVACQVLARGRVAALRLSLAGFDTHRNQPAVHAGLLAQLADGLLALRTALVELGRWNETLLMSYAEFGRRPRENESNGTDHGTAAPHFVLGGRVAGGLYGAPPQLNALDGNGNLPFAVDFRSLYATALERWWGVPAAPVLGGRFAHLPLLRG